MNHAQQHERDGWALEQPAKIHHFNELVAAKLSERVEVFCEALFVPSGYLLRSFYVFRQRGGVHIEDTVDYRFQEAILGDGDMPDELDGALGDGVGPVL